MFLIITIYRIINVVVVISFGVMSVTGFGCHGFPDLLISCYSYDVIEIFIISISQNLIIQLVSQLSTCSQFSMLSVTTSIRTSTTTSVFKYK